MKVKEMVDLDIRYLPAIQAWCLCWRDGVMVTVRGRQLYPDRHELVRALDFDSWDDWRSWRDEHLLKEE